MSTPAIEVVGLKKSFRRRRRLREYLRPFQPVPRTEALRGVDLEVGRGELVTLLGPNGAGKTTLLKIISTLVTPTEGTVKVMGDDVVAEPGLTRARVGYVLADERSFYWRLSCRDNLLFFAALEGIHGAAAKRRIDELAALVGLKEQLDREFHVLSTGQRQRLAIARGLVADPPVLLFDEATRSLDPSRAERLRRVIREVLVRQAGKGVLFATHSLEEARELSDRVVVMAEGRVARHGAFADVQPEVKALFDAETADEAAEFERVFPGLLAQARAPTS
ncbi:MAG: ABC transporter ATP-binding protein [Deltaproteobacteria bacterium]|nr:ABC transporter ATP-binding protein [Deltaproteobacteria bacterium]